MLGFYIQEQAIFYTCNIWKLTCDKYFDLALKIKVPSIFSNILFSTLQIHSFLVFIYPRQLCVNTVNSIIVLHALVVPVSQQCACHQHKTFKKENRNQNSQCNLLASLIVQSCLNLLNSWGHLCSALRSEDKIQDNRQLVRIHTFFSGCSNSYVMNKIVIQYICITFVMCLLIFLILSFFVLKGIV